MIRLARGADAAAIAAIYRPIVQETIISFEEIAPSAAVMRAKIDEGLVRYPWLVEERDGEILGYVYASEHRSRAAYRWSVDVSAYVHQKARGERFHRAFAGIALPNDASVALHRSLGFTPIGVYREVGFKAGAWRDVGWYERPLGPPEPPLGDPLAPGAIDAETCLASLR